ncbi:hypothetical protein HYT24_00765, partial [Candidatus Pacearchaeota archaeon]|nr:hypothetical protein [Candidatus Pacearchaeota archaeon]
MVEDTPKQQTKEEWEAGRRKHVQDHIAEAMVNGDTVWLNLHGKKRKDDLSVEGYCRREGDNYEILAMNKKQQIMAVTIGVNNVNPSNFGYEGDRENAQVKVYAPSEEGYQERLDRIANSG